MHGAPVSLVAEIGIPNAWQCLSFAAPILAVYAGFWLISRVDVILHRLFPDWEWERQLGWLNISLERRVDAVLRWIGYVFFATLAVTLGGIVWGAQAVPLLSRWTEPGVMADLAFRLPVLMLSLTYWLVYLGLSLIPKLRHHHEEEELAKFRVEQMAIEREREAAQVSRGKSLPKPRFDSPLRANRPGPKR